MNGEFIVTNALSKTIAGLDDAKGRRKSGLFVAEGRKCVETLLEGGFVPEHIFVDAEAPFTFDGAHTVRRGTLRAMTRLGTTPPAIALFRLPEVAVEVPSSAYIKKNLVLALDRIQDPGNMGTILRTADWMGIDTIVASIDTVDIFNPKTVQASMGAIARVKVVYTSLPDFLAGLGDVPVYGTFLDGDNIYRAPLSQGGVVVMGNEGSGISDAAAAHINRRLFIPPWGDGCVSESLNVGSATAIVLSQFRQRSFNG